MIIYIVDLCLVDLSDGEGRFLQLEHAEKIEIYRVDADAMGFLPNGDLVIVSRGYKIYLYSVENKPTTNTTLWKCSQIYDIETTEILEYPRSFVYQTKLFFLNKRLMIQWNLLEMTFDMQYFFDHFKITRYTNIMINKSQTLLALNNNGVFSMGTGMPISRYG